MHETCGVAVTVSYLRQANGLISVYISSISVLPSQMVSGFVRLGVSMSRVYPVVCGCGCGCCRYEVDLEAFHFHAPYIPPYRFLKLRLAVTGSMSYISHFMLLI